MFETAGKILKLPGSESWRFIRGAHQEWRPLILSASFPQTTRRSQLSNRKHLTYAYVVTLLGVLVATITTAYTTVRSMFAQRRFRPNFNSGNFTATNQFGNFTGPRQFGYVNPYAGVINGITIVALIIAIIGIVWLGISLKKAQAVKK